MPSAAASALATGDPPSSWRYGQPAFQDSNPIWLEALQTRLDKLEKIINQLDKEEKIREKSVFVQELYDQYKVALALLEDPDE